VIRTAAVALAAAAMAASLGACGASDDEKPGSKGGSVPVEQLVGVTGCSKVTHGGGEEPDYIVAASTALQGQYTDHGIQVVQALESVMEARNWRAGDYRVGLQVCNEAPKSGGPSDPAKCRRNARAFARNPRVIALIGPFASGCAAEMLPILNRAPGGPVTAIGASTTYLGLTRSGPGVGPGEPARYFPSGRRSFIRVVPADDAQAAAAVLYAQRHGAKRAFVLDDAEPYGSGLAEAFRATAERSGLAVAGRAQWDMRSHSYRPLARRIHASRADFVFLGGLASSNGPRLVKDLRETLGPRVVLFGPDGFLQAEPIVEGAGSAAEGFTSSIAVLPVGELPPAGREFATRFKRRFGNEPCCYSVRTAQAANLLLDAIAASGGRRPRVAEHLLGRQVKGGLLGDFSIDQQGDTTDTTIGVYRIESGRLKFVMPITPPKQLLARK
jgi:branched-chain amino acid transport system substrate-binding protein